MFLMLPLQHSGTCRHGDKKAPLKSLSCVEASQERSETGHRDYPRYCRRSTDTTHTGGLAASITRLKKSLVGRSRLYLICSGGDQIHLHEGHNHETYHHCTSLGVRALRYGRLCKHSSS